MRFNDKAYLFEEGVKTDLVSVSFLLVVVDFVGDFIVSCVVDLFDFVIGTLVIFLFFEATAINRCRKVKR